MLTTATFLADITFFEVCATLLVLGCLERVLVRLPNEMVGPGGWLVDTGAQR